MGAKRVSKQGVTVSQGNAIEVTNTAGTVLFSVDNTGNIGALPNLTAKGSLITASATSTPTTLAVGTNEQRLVADSATTSGLKYVADTTNYAIAAKGDLLVGTAADTVQALAVGTNGHTLVADSAEATGLKWAAASYFPNSDSAEVTTGQSTTSSSYTDLATSGPAVTVTTGTKAFVIITASISNNSNGYGSTASYAVSGATTISAQDKYSVSMRQDGTNPGRHVQKASVGYMIENLTAGSNTFTMKYKAETGSTADFSDRLITVIDMGS